MRLSVAALLFAVPAIGLSQPAVDLGTNTPQNFSSVIVEPSVAMNPTGTQFALAYGDASNDIQLEIRNISDGTIANSASIASGTSGYTGDGEINVAWSPDGNIIALGYSPGDDGGVEFQLYTPTATTIGSLVVLADGVNDPDFDFFSDGTILVAYEGGEGADGSGGFMRRFQTDGTEITGSAQVMAQGSITNDQNDPIVAIIREGSFVNDLIVTAWEDAGTTRFTGDDDTNYRIFNSSFVPQTAITPIPMTGAEGTQAKIGNPAVAVSPDGEFFIAVEGEEIGDDEAVFASFFDDSQVNVTPAGVTVADDSNRNRNIAAYYYPQADAFAVTYNGRNTGTASVAFYDVAGNKLGSTINVASSETADAQDSFFAFAENAGVGVWRDDVDDAGYFRIFTIEAGTTNVPNWFLY